MALSTDYALRTGAFEPAEASVNAQDLRGSCECVGEGCLGRSRFSGLLCNLGRGCLQFVLDFLISLVPHLFLSPLVPGHSAGVEGEGSEPIQPRAGECVPAASMPGSLLFLHWSLKPSAGTQAPPPSSPSSDVPLPESSS